ncbi:MAG: hypothetical protein KC414_06740, partial [Romboutsia sp.]|nr:hypothetical protein [Romboutsia sp.]
QYELDKAGLFSKDSDYDGMIGKAVMELINTFSNQGHSGFSAMWVNELFSKLSKYETLTELTSNEEEWVDIAKYDLGDKPQILWQSKRNPACFSQDGGKTYYHVDNPEIVKETLTETLNKYANKLENEVSYLNEFVESLSEYAKNKFSLEYSPAYELINDDETNAENLLGKTAYYDPNSKTISVYTLGRHPKDILRSYAHVYIHYKQDLEERLKDIYTTDINEDSNLRKLEEEAYLEGNILFREWETQYKK